MFKVLALIVIVGSLAEAAGPGAATMPADSASQTWLNSEAYDVALCSSSDISIKIIRVTSLNDTKEHRQRPLGPQVGFLALVKPLNSGAGIPATVEYVRDSSDRFVDDVVVTTKSEVIHLGTTMKPQELTLLGEKMECTRL